MVFKKNQIAWNKGLKGNEYLKHYKDNSTWLMKNKNDEINKKQSETLKRLYKEGKLIPPNKGKKLLYLTERNLLDNPSKRPEIRKKQSETRLKLLKEGKIKSWNKGKKCPQLSGKNNGFYGKKQSEESKKKMSLAKKGKKLSINYRKKMSEIKKKLFLDGKLPKNVGALGKDNPAWKGGISFEPYGLEFNKKIKNLVRKRDNQICMNCGIHREKYKRIFDIHHVNYDKECNIEQNLISLCRNCHSLTGFNREYWTKLFQDKLSKLYNYKYLNGEIIIEI